jgi:PPOX class probable F420-dependent enzyme
MGLAIEGRRRELLEGPNLGYMATIRDDGTPHVVPAWVDVDGDMVILDSAEGRAGVAHLRRDPRVTLTVQNHENPFEYLTLRGHAVQGLGDPTFAHIDRMAVKYLGMPTDPFRRPNEVRVLFAVEVHWMFLFPTDFGVPHPGDPRRGST